MTPEINPMPTDQEIQLYHNDFYNGFIRLIRKLFMF